MQSFLSDFSSLLNEKVEALFVTNGLNLCKLIICRIIGGKNSETICSEKLIDNGVKCYFIRDCETLNIVLIPTKYLKHRTVMNRCPHSVKRTIFVLCYYFEYLAEKQPKISQIYDMSYSKQFEHFVKFMHRVKMGQYRNESGKKSPKNGACSAYLQEVFGFYRYM